MCIHKKFYYKIIFWTSLVALILVTIFGIVGIVEMFKLKARFDSYDEIFHGKYSLMIIMMLVSVILITLASILGIVGVLMDYFPVLIIASYAMVIVSIISLIVAFWVQATSREVVNDFGMTNTITKELQDLVRQPDFLALNNTVLDPIQLDFECCGVNSFEDYAASTTRKWMRDILPLPKSCCIDPTKNCLPNSDEHKKQGCLQKFLIYATGTFNDYAVLLTVFGIATGINGMYTFLLSKKAKENYLYYPYYF